MGRGFNRYVIGLRYYTSKADISESRSIQQQQQQHE